MAEVEIVRAEPADFPAICRLLEAAGLPGDDLTAEHASSFLVARIEGVVVGTVAVESHGDLGMLRSLSVEASQRRLGLGMRLVNAAEEQAALCGFRRLYLLTTTVERFFMEHGYRHTDRQDAPRAIANTPQFSSLCPSSSAFMSKSI